MIKKKIMAWACVLVSCVVMSGIPVSADTISYYWQFNSASERRASGSGYKDDTEQNYYITINQGNVSDVNIFGTRIRRLSDDAYMSSYVLHYGLEQSQPYPYSSIANTYTKYCMRGQKDSASTVASALNAVGKVTY